MKNLIAISLFLFFCSTANSQVYQLNTSSAQLVWAGSAAFSAYSLSGTLKVKSGNLMIKDDQLSTTDIIIDMKSLDAEIKDLRQHLRSADFFDVKKYPQAVFQLKEVVDIKEGEVVFKGLFTIKETTKEESFTLKAHRQNDRWIFKGKITLDRTAYGIYYNSPNFFENLKQNAIADDISLDVELTFEAT
jgi:polyisoprenoid-binding protein YceI